MEGGYSCYSIICSGKFVNIKFAIVIDKFKPFFYCECKCIEFAIFEYKFIANNKPKCFDK